MNTKTLGWTGEQVSALGLGCMGMSHAYGRRDDRESLSTLERALELGVTFWDTADYYGNGDNERLIAKALKGNRGKVFLATKFGLRAPKSGDLFAPVTDGSPAWMKTAVESSLQRLKTDYIDLYYLHRVDPKVPVEETVGAMAALVREGKIRYIGLSEVSADTLRRAHSVHRIAALQSEYSLLSREIEAEILPAAKALRTALIPFSPLGRGMFTSTFDLSKMPETDARRTMPRFQGHHLENNRCLVEALTALAREKGIDTAQLALAWIMAKGDHIIPIPGTKRSRYLEKNTCAADVVLDAADIAAIEAVIAKYPDTGDRYPESALKLTSGR